MNLTARSSAAVLLGLTFTLGAPAPSALAQADPDCTPSGNKCGDTEPGCIPSDNQPKKCEGVEAAGNNRPTRADTGFGGSSSSGSETTILMVGGGLLALGAAVGVRRASRGGKA